MTMSVGLGRIINDPKASIIVRKALGALSTPGLIVTDEGVTIDNTGRIAIKINPDGGLAQDDDGIAVGTGRTVGFPVVTGFVGIQVNLELAESINPVNAWSYYAGDASVEIGSSVENHYGYYVEDLTAGTISNAAFCGDVAAATGQWNVYMSGTAANHFAGSVAIGTTTVTAKLSVLSTTEQLRLEYDASNYCGFTVGATGTTTIQATGVKLNTGAVIKRFLTATATLTINRYTPDGIIDYTITVTGAQVGDSVIVSPVGLLTNDAASWSGAVSSTNTVTVRILNAAAVLGGSYSWDIRVTVIGF